jgi:serralysin
MPGFRQNLFTSRPFADSDSTRIFGFDAFNRFAAAHGGPRQFEVAASSAGGSRLTNATPDNYQPVESAWYVPGPTALVDTYTAAPNTTGTLVVDDPNHVLAASDTPGDQDWFAVTLTAGETYQFGQYARAGGLPGAEGNGVPLADSYLEIYDSTGHLLGYADGGGPNTPQGLDALMTFEAPYSGTYYVNATSYDNSGDGIGDFAGDYEIFAITAPPGATVYATHYDISSPLHSIDWGGVLVNREHVSVRNPDGNDGPRPTGEPAADPAEVQGNFLGFPGKNVVYIYFAGQGDIYANTGATIPAQVTAQDPYQYEIQAVLTAAAEFSKVADVVFVSNYTLNPTTHLYERDPTIEYKPGPLGPEAGMKYATGVDGDGFDADFFYWSYPGTPGPGISLLGSMNPPDYQDEGVAQFNSADERWSAQMLQQGGFSFVTLIHEFGHGMGLAHPHDTGGGSSIMPGVVTSGVPGDDGGAGTYGLNQGIYTMMSYNDGWESSPYGSAETNNEGYGWLGSLMALDIAVIQDKYGVNEDWATGNDTYVLKDENEWGVYIDSATGQPAQHGPDDAATSRDGYYEGRSTYYSSIWDAGGVDQIVYNGARDANIDLRPATLKYEAGGGGWVSYATGIFGGFTIANGATIENAISGSGNDKLTGNAASNRLEGNAGNDSFYLYGGGNDTALGGAGNDIFFLGAAYSAGDTIRGGADLDTFVLQGNYNITLGTLVSEIEGISLLAGTNTSLGATGTALYSYSITTNDANFAAGVQAKVNGAALLAGENFTFNGSAETNASFVVYGGKGTDTFTGGQGNDIFFFAEDRFATGDTVNGGAGYDGMFLRGNYTIDFNAPGYTGLFTNIENLTLTSATDERYARGGGTEFDYNLTLSNALTGAAQTLTVSGALLMASETMVVDGSLESNGNLRLFGGAAADTLKGGALADTLHGNLGADSLTGNGGADTFLYHTTAESTTGSVDQILDFAHGSDKLDLAKIDANTLVGGDQAFTWIGSNAFGATGAASAGQLRAYQDGANWFVQGDTNGDGTADLIIQLTVTGGALTQSDFLP